MFAFFKRTQKLKIPPGVCGFRIESYPPYQPPSLTTDIITAVFKRKQHRRAWFRSHSEDWIADLVSDVEYQIKVEWWCGENSRFRLPEWRWIKKMEADAASMQSPLIEARVEAQSDRLLRDAIKHWSESLSVTVHVVNLEEINRVLRTDANVCREMLGNQLAATLLIHFTTTDESLARSFDKMMQCSKEPRGLNRAAGMNFQGTITHLHLGIILYSAALKALPIAEALEKSAQLDNAFPQVAPPGATRRF